MRQILLVMSGLAVLVFSGVVHGLWTDRWSDRSDLIEAANRLERLPMELGEWQGTDFDQSGERNTTLAGALSRRYVNRVTGQAVSIYLGCGRPGPVSIHTPEVCYAGSGYEVERPSAFTIPPGEGMPKGEFWTARYIKEKADRRTTLRLFWSWHAQAGWAVADNPRVAFARERLLYKLYVVRELAAADEAIATDPCVEFMRLLLPAIEETYFRGNVLHEKEKG